MTWFRVDDNLAFHSKTIAAGNEAMGLWVRAGAWSSQMLTDGFVPNHMIPALSGGKDDLSACLVLAGLWVVVPKGYRFHEWNERNPTGTQVKEKREKEAVRKADWRAKKAANAPASTNGVASPADVPAGQERQSPRDTHVSPTVSPEDVPAGVPPLVRDLSALTRPDPTRPLKASIQDSSGGGTEDNARRSKTPPKIRCEQHQQIDPEDPGPNCLRCRDARFEAAEEIRRANVAQGTEIRRAVLACRRCDELGWRLDADGHPAEPARRCDHQPPLRSVS